MDQSSIPFPTRHQKKDKTKLAVIIGLVLLVVILVVGFLILREPKKGDIQKNTVIEPKEPSPTEKPKIDKTVVKIQVLNGTGTPGQAALVVKALEEAGYSADNIKSSNAAKYDNKTTTISTRSNFEDTANDIKDTLNPTFEEISISSSKLADDSAFDIVIVTGGKIFSPVTPTTASSSSQSSSSSSSSSVAPSSTPSPTPSPTLTPTPTP